MPEKPLRLQTNIAGQVGPSAPSTVRTLQTLQKTPPTATQNAINTKTMAKTYKCQKNTADETLGPSR